ncbi:tail fiber protein [Oceanihabitans sp. 2_MG-2023]|uniref:phage tail protein n=1 Tax=Oceanihabitans sp. 2_MG-2023 TaxID=3062661 RepID=UPI0026E35267|nr:tail fiber protein [Oceanihabitans sp. 2_MG-2023]MDO6596380.1 tail fiber protein [Oceanihabitans sp. 2_MG-2023]
MKKTISILCLLLCFSFSNTTNAQSDPYLGQISMFAGNFAPRGWAFCDGTLLPINSNQALFSLLGTIYGGDGRTTFALPDLRGRAPIHAGQGPGLSNYSLGQGGGVEQVYLTTNQLPSHSHTTQVNATSPIGRGQNSDDPTNNFWAEGGSYAPTSNTTMSTNAVIVVPTGGSQGHENRQPYTTINYIIALQGTYPSRN